MSIVPPFTAETAYKKVKLAQKLWNTRNPDMVVKAYTADTIWRNRDRFLQGTEQIRAFLQQKWEKEHSYKLKKELFTFRDNKIAVQFWYEYCPDPKNHPQQWKRCYGLEDWTFDWDGKMAKRQMSGNEIDISEQERWYKDHITEEEIDELKLDDKHY